LSDYRAASYSVVVLKYRLEESRKKASAKKICREKRRTAARLNHSNAHGLTER